jgi:hypothetical protein
VWQFAGIHFARLGQSHQGVGLVITEARIRAGLYLDRGKIRVRQDLGDDLLESLFEGQVQHGWKWTGPIVTPTWNENTAISGVRTS